MIMRGWVNMDENTSLFLSALIHDEEFVRLLSMNHSQDWFNDCICCMYLSSTLLARLVE